MTASNLMKWHLMQLISWSNFLFPFQHLQLFTEYGRMALRETGTKPFQKLQFLVLPLCPDPFLHTSASSMLSILSNSLHTFTKTASKLFLVKVRDWHYPHDAPFGGEGGELVLQRLLAADEDQPFEVLRFFSSYQKLVISDNQNIFRIAYWNTSLIRVIKHATVCTPSRRNM